MIDKYKAKDVKTGEIVEGYYAEYKEYVDAPDCKGGIREVYTKHVILEEGRTAPNRLIEHEIDMRTLQPVNIVAEKVMTRDDIKKALLSRGLAPTERNVDSVLSTRALTYLNGYSKDEYETINKAIDLCKGLKKYSENTLYTSRNEEIKEGTTVSLRIDRTDGPLVTGWIEHPNVNDILIFVGEVFGGDIPEEEEFYLAKLSLDSGDVKGYCFERMAEEEHERCYLTIIGKAA